MIPVGSYHIDLSPHTYKTKDILLSCIGDGKHYIC